MPTNKNPRTMTTLPSYAQRFRELRKFLGLSQKEFGDKLEITQSGVSQIESGRNTPSTSVFEKASEVFPNLNKQWLYNGEGEMFPDNTTPPAPAAQRPGGIFLSGDSPRDLQRLKAENDMLKSRVELMEGMGNEEYLRRRGMERELDLLRTERETAKANMVERVVRLTEKTPFAVTVDSAGNDNIVMVATKAAAGYMQGCVEPEYIRNLPAFSIPSPEYRNGSFRAFQVNGQSMEPTLRTGDWLICELTESPKSIRNGEMYVVVSDSKESLVVKRVDYTEGREKMYLQSDNRLYPTYSLGVEDVKEIWRVKANLSTQLSKNFLHPTELELAKMRDELQDLRKKIS